MGSVRSRRFSTFSSALLLVLIVTLGVGASGCASSTPTSSSATTIDRVPGAATDPFSALERGDPSLSFATGAIDGTELLVATAYVPGGPYVAYVCDGKGIGQWFSGSGEVSGDGRVAVRGENFVATTTSASNGAAMTGSVTVGGESVDFVTRPASVGGLLRQVDESTTPPTVSGWILTDEGVLVGIRAQVNPTVSQSPVVVQSLKVKLGTEKIDQTMQESLAKSDTAMQAATTALMLALVSGATQSASASAAGGSTSSSTTTSTVAPTSRPSFAPPSVR